MKGKLRRCLKCNEPFWSKGAANRLCGPCNKDNVPLIDKPVYVVPKPGEKR